MASVYKQCPKNEKNAFAVVAQMYSCVSVTFIYKQMRKVFDTVINMVREKLLQRQCSNVLFSSSGNVKARTEL